MSNLVLSSSVAALIAADVANVEKSAKSRYVAVDAMVAAGIRSTDWISPKAKDSGSTATPELYAALRDAVIAGFSASDRQLLAITSKAAVAALKPEKAARRTYVQQQIGSRMKDYKNALKRREESATDTGSAGGKKRPAMDRLLDHLGKALSVLKTESDFAFEVAPMVERLTKEVALVTLAMKAK